MSADHELDMRAAYRAGGREVIAIIAMVLDDTARGELDDETMQASRVIDMTTVTWMRSIVVAFGSLWETEAGPRFDRCDWAEAIKQGEAG